MSFWNGQPSNIVEPMQAQAGIEKLKQMLAESQRTVVFTGAGISTESGIPDFRSPGGVWDKYRPIDFKDFLNSEEMRRESWRRKFATDGVVRQAEPNLGHFAVAQLVQQKKVSSVITQNVDGLHQKSGVPDHQVIELHGNTTYAACLDCKKRYSLLEVRKMFGNDETVPACEDCRGFIKTATISFGQPMPAEPMARAEVETRACDLFLAIGSSLVVYPAAGFPELAVRHQAKLVIINRDATRLDPLADVVLHCEIGPTLSQAVGLGGGVGFDHLQ